MQETVSISQYYPIIIGFLVSCVVALVSFTANRIIASNEKTKANLKEHIADEKKIHDRHDARLDLLEAHISTTNRDLQLLRKEHERELERCHSHQSQKSKKSR
jgi:sensor domain CHASE-containing protein